MKIGLNASHNFRNLSFKNTPTPYIDKKVNEENKTTSDFNKKTLDLSLCFAGFAAIYALLTSERKLWTTPIMAGVGFIIGKVIEIFINNTNKK
ncbi:MAG: hypothetical protein WCK67_10865 [bacterium]